MFLIPAGQFGFLYFAALFTQNVLGYTPLQTGLAVAPFSLALVPTNLLTPHLVARYGERVTGTGGMIGLFGGLVWMAQIDGWPRSTRRARSPPVCSVRSSCSASVPD
jgi:MFS family permease